MYLLGTKGKISLIIRSEVDIIKGISIFYYIRNFKYFDLILIYHSGLKLSFEFELVSHSVHEFYPQVVLSVKLMDLLNGNERKEAPILLLSRRLILQSK
jgi:hypothetical protein